MTVPEIEAKDVPAGAYLLDVREQGEWVAGHAPDAVHIPMGELQARLDEVPAGQPVYVVCRVGGRSAHAAAWLNHVGREAVNVGGGMQSWEAARRPMVSESGQEPFVA
ncbi:rhodanese-like domain-containing protein [Nonomuraea endophytica]|uniref:Rhodanese-related sulfurtransferase n=1 Tax=Nonomuraea endophytica TaxID=714136 RepID=A0A7W8EE15_9ACTN|nr:rhodanese-like domain-containing protein [Nonomuraea endophytica]MBB5075881.1 rhodanese-related sulfurtransferase [Nonomuraea endophytica]